MEKKNKNKGELPYRAAVLPEWLEEGRTVWFWRDCFCDGTDLCSDSVGPMCPLNSLRGRPSPEVIGKCARHHPQLDQTVIWAVSAAFEPGKILWTVNEAYTVREEFLRATFFPSREAALARRPEEIVYG